MFIKTDLSQNPLTLGEAKFVYPCIVIWSKWTAAAASLSQTTEEALKNLPKRAKIILICIYHLLCSLSALCIYYRLVDSVVNHLLVTDDMQKNNTIILDLYTHSTIIWLWLYCKGCLFFVYFYPLWTKIMRILPLL